MRRISKNDQWFTHSIAEVHRGHRDEQNKNT